MGLRERSVRRGQCHCAHVKRRGPSHWRHSSCWALVRAAHPRLKMFRLARREGLLALVFTPPKVRKQGKRSINPTPPKHWAGERSGWEQDRGAPAENERKDSVPGVEGQRQAGGQGEGTQRSGTGTKTALKTPERQRQSGKPRLMCQNQQMRSDTGQSLPCLYRSEPRHPGNRLDCASMAASETIHTDRFQHSSLISLNIQTCK